MKSKELKAALNLLTKVAAESSLEPDQKANLQKAKRELEAVAGSGKLDNQRLFRAIEIVATVMLELVVVEHADLRSK